MYLKLRVFLNQYVIRKVVILNNIIKAVFLYNLFFIEAVFLSNITDVIHCHCRGSNISQRFRNLKRRYFNIHTHNFHTKILHHAHIHTKVSHSRYFHTAIRTRLPYLYPLDKENENLVDLN